MCPDSIFRTFRRRIEWLWPLSFSQKFGGVAASKMFKFQDILCTKMVLVHRTAVRSDNGYQILESLWVTSLQQVYHMFPPAKISEVGLSGVSEGEANQFHHITLCNEHNYFLAELEGNGSPNRKWNSSDNNNGAIGVSTRGDMSRGAPHVW